MLRSPSYSDHSSMASTPRPETAGQGPLSMIEQMFMDQQSVTAWTGHRRDSFKWNREGT
jgi:hypothetical protein